MRCLGPILSAEPIGIIYLFYFYFLGVTSEFYPCHLLILPYLVKFTWAPLSILHSFICTISIYCSALFTNSYLALWLSLPLTHSVPFVLQAFLICSLIYLEPFPTSVSYGIAAHFIQVPFQIPPAKEPFLDYSVQNNISPQTHLFIYFLDLF